MPSMTSPRKQAWVRVGPTSLITSTLGFGAATIVFGLSRSFPLSMAMLVLLGALDNISVVVRHTLVQRIVKAYERYTEAAARQLPLKLGDFPEREAEAGENGASPLPSA
mgnify:CR=1 FL=1